MKIALVAHHVSQPAQPQEQHCPDPACAELAAQLLGLGKALAQAGHRVVIYARQDRAGLPETVAIERRLTMRFIKAGPAKPLPACELPAHIGALAEGLSGYWRKSPPDIVHAFGWPGGLAALAATRDNAIPVVASLGSLAATERSSGIPGPQYPGRARLEACVGRAAAALIATTGQEVSDLAKIGIPWAKVTLVPCGTDVATFGPEGPAARRAHRQRLVHLGGLTTDRRLDILVRAMPELPDTELVLAGGPSPGTVDADPAAKRLGKLAASLGVADRVTCTGRLSDKELASLLRSADLIVSVAGHEPVGHDLVAAMACGVPVIAPSAGAYADAVEDGTSGLLVPPGRPELVARRARDLLAMPMRRTAFGIAAADRARSRYPWQRVAAEAVAVYERHALAAQADSEAGVSPRTGRDSARSAASQAAA